MSLYCFHRGIKGLWVTWIFVFHETLNLLNKSLFEYVTMILFVLRIKKIKFKLYDNFRLSLKKVAHGDKIQAIHPR